MTAESGLSKSPKLIRSSTAKKGSAFTSYMHHYVRAASLQSHEAIALHIEADIEKYTKQKSDIDEMPPQSLNTLRYAIWLNDKTPNVDEYGTRELEKNPNKLQEIKLPWLIGKKGTPLIDQMIAIQMRRRAIAAERLLEALLRAFLLKLNNPAIPNEELLAALQELPQETQWKLHKLIYLAHKIKFGEELVNHNTARSL